MKSGVQSFGQIKIGRTPHGVRGLKCTCKRRLKLHWASHPSRGAWIEIVRVRPYGHAALKSHPSRGAWIEITVP